MKGCRSDQTSARVRHLFPPPPVRSVLRLMRPSHRFLAFMEVGIFAVEGYQKVLDCRWNDGWSHPAWYFTEEGLEFYSKEPTEEMIADLVRNNAKRCEFMILEADDRLSSCQKLAPNRDFPD